MSMESNKTEWWETCQDNFIINPTNNVVIAKDSEFSILNENGIFSPENTFPNHLKRVTVVKPQYVRMSLRSGMPSRIKLRLQLPKRYPFDLYILIGMSENMLETKSFIIDQVIQLSEVLQNGYKNYRVGVGIFDEDISNNKSRSHAISCKPPYGIKNIQRLSRKKDISEKLWSVMWSPVNIGFESVSKAVKCRKKIGWREVSRRYLLIITDVDFKGSSQNSDGELENDETVEDYWSSYLPQLQDATREGNVHLMLALFNHQFIAYSDLSLITSGPSLIRGYSNLAHLFEAAYIRLNRRVELIDNAKSPVSISYYSNCYEEETYSMETSTCDNVEPRKELEFMLKVKFEVCPESQFEWKQKINIMPFGFSYGLVIELDLICDCSPLELSKVLLPYPWEETGLNLSSMHGMTRMSACKLDDDEHTELCSGRGSCILGNCMCNVRANPDEKVYGRYCECTNFLCDYTGGQMCSGRGTCECDRCVCNAGWVGSACECDDHVDQCLNPDTGKVCSDRGTCECNQCSCFDEFSGKYCEDCPTCSDTCGKFKPCVECLVFGIGPFSEEECSEKCSFFSFSLVQYARVEDSSKDRMCTYLSETNCLFHFVYSKKDEEMPDVRVQSSMVCPKSSY